MKKLFAVAVCSCLLAACGHKNASTPADTAASAASAASSASAPEITYSNASKPATYDPNLKPAPTGVTLNLGGKSR